MNNETKNPHPHAELIHKWADGARIQTYNKGLGKWFDCNDNQPDWRIVAQYRVKPEESERRIEPKPGDTYLYVDSDGIVVSTIWENRGVDDRRRYFGNCFRTHNDAEAAAERVKAALKGEESEEVKKLRKENEELKTRCENLHKAKECSSLSDGELALIKAVREVRINHITEGGETTYSCVVTYDEKIVNAFRQIQAEQEANND